MKFTAIENKLFERIDNAHNVNEAIEIAHTAKILLELGEISREAASIILGNCADLADDLDKNLEYFKAFEGIF